MQNGLYRWYVLIILALTYGFSFMDRQIVSIVLEDLREEFLLSDTQLGLLSGLAFALFYATLGIPIARLADRYNRVNIVSIAVAVWSAMTAICGLAGNFWQLFLARVGVGVGEAGGGPPSHSIISDYFGPNERSFAISVYSMGPALGMMLGLMLGGYIAENYGWRMVFICAGIPGVGLALLVKLTLREPVRGGMDPEAVKTDAAPRKETFLEASKALWSNVTYRRVNIGHTLAVFTAYGLTVWKPAFYLRQFELTQTEVGLIVGGMSFVAGVPGVLLGGYIADRLSHRDHRWPAWLASMAVLAAFPVYLAGLWVADWMIATALIGLGLFLYQLSHGPGLAIVQTVVEPYRRAQAAAFVFFFSNMLGLGLGPLLVGYISDSASAQYGDQSLTVALTASLFILFAASFMYYRTAVALGPHPENESTPAKTEAS